MQTNNYNGIVSRAEADALKELIFNRVRQRTEALAKNAQNQYMDSMKDEIMDLARNSFNNPNNPFTIKSQNDINKTNKTQAEKGTEVGFKQKLTEERINEIIKQRNESSNGTIIQSERLDLIKNAGMEFKSSQQFTGALQFLNAQAGINMADKSKAKFDTLA